jgi:hypothetical protein
VGLSENNPQKIDGLSSSSQSNLYKIRAITCPFHRNITYVYQFYITMTMIFSFFRYIAWISEYTIDIPLYTIICQYNLHIDIYIYIHIYIIYIIYTYIPPYPAIYHYTLSIIHPWYIHYHPQICSFSFHWQLHRRHRLRLREFLWLQINRCKATGATALVTSLVESMERPREVTTSSWYLWMFIP